MDAASQFFSDYPLLAELLKAAIILAVTWIVEHLVFRALKRIGRHDNIDLPSSSIFANIARVLIWIGGIAFAAKTAFDYDITAFITALGVGGIALSLGLQDTIKNLFGGLQITLGKIVKPGDYFDMDGMPSRVIDTTWRETRLVDASGTIYLVPNALMYTNMLKSAGASAYLGVPVLIDPASDLDAFTTEVLEVLEEPLEGKIGPKPTRVIMKGIVLGGMQAMVQADILRDELTADQASDLIMRTIDPIVKRYAPAVP